MLANLLYLGGWEEPEKAPGVGRGAVGPGAKKQARTRSGRTEKVTPRPPLEKGTWPGPGGGAMCLFSLSSCKFFKPKSLRQGNIDKNVFPMF